MKSSCAAQLFARERLAGYSPERLNAADVAMCGAGALANNVLLNLALGGVGRVRIADPDVCEVSNATRSPLMKRDRLAHGVRRWKAHEAALGFLSHAYAAAPAAYAATERVEALGLGAFVGCQALVSAVDRDEARAWISDAGVLLGIPTIEAGFHGRVGQVTLFRHDDPNAACWRCLRPAVESGSASCLRYALAVQSEGRIPATQPVAALFGALVAHAALEVLHDAFALASTMVTFDLERGTSRRLVIDRNPACPGPHRSLGQPMPLTVGSSGAVGDLFSELESLGAGPSVVLPSPFVVRLPCRRCGRALPVGRAAFEVEGAPACKACPPTAGKGAPLAFSILVRGNVPETMKLGRLGLGPGGLFETLFADGRSRVVRLADDPLRAFRHFVRSVRSAGEGVVMDP